MTKGNQTERGFTLVELLVVIAIISLLSSVVLASLNQARAKARDARRVADMRQISLALDMFFDDKRHYPGDEEGIDQGVGFKIGDGSNNSNKFAEAMAPYISPMPTDPYFDRNPNLYYYSYDAHHAVCTAANPSDQVDVAAVLAFHTAETQSIRLPKGTYCGGDMNQNNAAYNMLFFPSNN